MIFLWFHRHQFLSELLGDLNFDRSSHLRRISLRPEWTGGFRTNRTVFLVNCLSRGFNHLAVRQRLRSLSKSYSFFQLIFTLSLSVWVISLLDNRSPHGQIDERLFEFLSDQIMREQIVNITTVERFLKFQLIPGSNEYPMDTSFSSSVSIPLRWCPQLGSKLVKEPIWMRSFSDHHSLHTHLNHPSRNWAFTCHMASRCVDTSCVWFEFKKLFYLLNLLLVAGEDFQWSAGGKGVRMNPKVFTHTPIS